MVRGLYIFTSFSLRLWRFLYCSHLPFHWLKSKRCCRISPRENIKDRTCLGPGLIIKWQSTALIFPHTPTWRFICYCRTHSIKKEVLLDMLRVPLHVSGRFLFILAAVVLGKLLGVNTRRKDGFALIQYIGLESSTLLAGMGFQTCSVWLCFCSRGDGPLSAAWVELGHNWNFWGSDSAQIQMEERV